MKYLSTKEVAKTLDVSEGTVYNMKINKDFLPDMQNGVKSLYSKDRVDEYKKIRASHSCDRKVLYIARPDAKLRPLSEDEDLLRIDMNLPFEILIWDGKLASYLSRMMEGYYYSVVVTKHDFPKKSVLLCLIKIICQSRVILYKEVEAL